MLVRAGLLATLIIACRRVYGARVAGSERPVARQTLGALPTQARHLAGCWRHGDRRRVAGRSGRGRLREPRGTSGRLQRRRACTSATTPVNVKGTRFTPRRTACPVRVGRRSTVEPRISTSTAPTSPSTAT